MEQTKHYLKDVIPRVYDELIAWLHEIDRDELSPQVADMYIVDRCQCGSKWCIDFTIESSNTALYPINGRRPFMYDVTSKAALMIGMTGNDGAEILTGLEFLGDYSDDYIEKQLESIGLFKAPERD